MGLTNQDGNLKLRIKCEIYSEFFLISLPKQGPIEPSFTKRITRTQRENKALCEHAGPFYYASIESLSLASIRSLTRRSTFSHLFRMFSLILVVLSLLPTYLSLLLPVWWGLRNRHFRSQDIYEWRMFRGGGDTCL